MFAEAILKMNMCSFPVSRLSFFFNVVFSHCIFFGHLKDDVPVAIWFRGGCAKKNPIELRYSQAQCWVEVPKVLRAPASRAKAC